MLIRRWRIGSCIRGVITLHHSSCEAAPQSPFRSITSLILAHVLAHIQVVSQHCQSCSIEACSDYMRSSGFPSLGQSYYTPLVWWLLGISCRFGIVLDRPMSRHTRICKSKWACPQYWGFWGIHLTSCELNVVASSWYSDRAKYRIFLIEPSHCFFGSKMQGKQTVNDPRVVPSVSPGCPL